MLLTTGLFAEESAPNAEVRYGEIVFENDSYVVNADIEVMLNQRLKEAVLRGIALHFSVEFVVSQPRWYWLDEVLFRRKLDYRLSYHSITRSYRLASGNLYQSFETLNGALRTMQHIRSWEVAKRRKLEAGVSYKAALRLYLDTSMLPKPFQVSQLGNRDWSLETDWLRWTFLAGASR